jgi:predicted HTH domain antitoxin
MKTTTVSTRLPPEDLADLEEAAAAACLDRATMAKTLLRRGLQEVRLEMASRAYAEGRVTLSRAAEMARIPLVDFQDYLDRHHVPLNYDLVEFEEDMKHVKG